MDIDYLLLLQRFREGAGAFLAPLMDWVTKASVSFLPLAFLVMVYWAFDRKGGRRLLAGMSLSYLLNGFLKLTFCVYRPWIRDARIEPFGDAKVAATGYSFPSGHSTAATSRYGGVGLWLYRKGRRLLACVFFLLILLTMFSRNYLGVHTPQDVIVGLVASSAMIVLGYGIERWSDADPGKRDRILFLIGILVPVLCVAYYLLKAYPADLKPDGTLIVDYKKMLPDSFEGIGFVIAFSVCRYFERRGFDFEQVPWKDRFVIGTFALLPLAWWDGHMVAIVTDLINKSAGKFVWAAGEIVYVMILVPWIMKKVWEKKLLEPKE